VTRILKIIKKLNYETYKFRNEMVTNPPTLLVTLFFFQLPKSNCEWMAVVEQLTKWNFPHCLGSIDGKRADKSIRK
jgi:hypothetical protein